MKNPYFPTALGLYFNYLVHGMGVLLMSLNMASLETLWQTNAAGVSIVISSLGIGRLSVLLFAGLLSDRFGRRPLSCSGCAAIWPSFLASCRPITSLSLMFLAFWREWQTVFRCRHLSQFDGSFSTLTWDSQYFN